MDKRRLHHELDLGNPYFHYMFKDTLYRICNETLSYYNKRKGEWRTLSPYSSNDISEEDSEALELHNRFVYTKMENLNLIPEDEVQAYIDKLTLVNKLSK